MKEFLDEKIYHDYGSPLQLKRIPKFPPITPALAQCPDADGDGYTDSACGGADCDDTDPNVNPGQPVDVCDGKDTDCDGNIPWNDYDFDGDGYALCNGECDDQDAAVNPAIKTIMEGANPLFIYETSFSFSDNTADDNFIYEEKDGQFDIY